MDTIGMMLTHIRNGYKAKLKTVYSLYSVTLENVLKLLKEKKIIAGYKVVEVRKNIRRLEIELMDNMKSALTIKRISKPGRRVYIKAKEIRIVASGYGFAVISTPKGILDNASARKNNVGGEVLCEII
jgi:small subunit ribosomal protein S8